MGVAGKMLLLGYLLPQPFTKSVGSVKVKSFVHERAMDVRYMYAWVQ